MTEQDKTYIENCFKKGVSVLTLYRIFQETKVNYTIPQIFAVCRPLVDCPIVDDYYKIGSRKFTKKYQTLLVGIKAVEKYGLPQKRALYGNHNVFTMINRTAKLAEFFKNGMRNQQIADLFKMSYSAVASCRHKWRKNNKFLVEEL